ncbi:MAG: hypothetical protein SFV54_27235 [Bryobacteraceae bacterium]|nr:hypothetical protein [Bryobacteraceae bacterium]
MGMMSMTGALWDAAVVVTGASLTVATCLALGRLILMPIRSCLTTIEDWALGFLLGGAALSPVVLVLGLAGLIFPATFITVSLLAVSGQVLMWRRYADPVRPRFKKLSTIWRVALAITGVAYGVLYFVNALAPDTSPDGTGYHLGLLEPYLRTHRIAANPTSFHAMLSQGIEMIYLFAISVGAYSSAAIVHLAFLASLVTLVVAYGKRHGGPTAGALGAILLIACPVVGVDASSSYVDVAASSIAFGSFYLLSIWAKHNTGRLELFYAGLLAGFCYAAKYSVAVAVPIAAGMVIWELRTQWRSRRMVKGLGLLALGAALAAGPWVIRNLIWYQNPTAPFFNHLFPNQYVHVSLEESLRESLKNWGHLPSTWLLPIELATGGFALQGLLGPLFLLAPVGVLSVRTVAGRRLLLATLGFAAVYPASLGTRFLIPSLPFAALAFSMALGSRQRLSIACAVFHAVTCWPSVVALYCAPGSWRLWEFPLRAALRIEPEESYLRGRLGEWELLQFINEKTPTQSRILALGGLAKAYAKRDVLVAYESAIGEVLRDSLWTSHFKDFSPSFRREFVFPETRLRKLRVVSRSEGKDHFAQWSLAEVRLKATSGEMIRSRDWSIRSAPNGWDVSLAFDGNPATRWMTWERARTGMMVEVVLPSYMMVNGVVLETASEHVWVTPEVRAEVNGQWLVLARDSTVIPTTVDPHMRRAGIDFLRDRGITHLAVPVGDYLEKDLHDDWWQWGVSELGRFGDWRLFAIR